MRVWVGLGVGGHCNKSAHGEFHRSSSERTEEGMFEGELRRRRVALGTVQAWRTSCAKVLGQGNLMCLHGVKQKGQQRKCGGQGPGARPECQGMLHSGMYLQLVTAFPACGLAPSDQ